MNPPLQKKRAGKSLRFPNPFLLNTEFSLRIGGTDQIHSVLFNWIAKLLFYWQR